MNDDEEIYRWVDRRIPITVERESAQDCLQYADYEGAILLLMESADKAEALPREVAERIRTEFDGNELGKIAAEMLTA